MGGAAGSGLPGMPGIAEEENATGAEEEDVDTAGLDAGDISMVMEQGGVTRATAVKALREHGGDIVSAIMDLTM